LKQGQDIALISDAWTPGISDPGYILIKEALENDIEVIPIPWVTAFTTALMWSWMPMNHFLYLWFLPVKKWRQTLFNKLVERKKEKNAETVVIYESVHRIIKTLNEMRSYFWDEHYIVVWRELTKKFEEFKRGSITDIINYFENTPGKIKWEFVLMF
jgi:16S rRNA (cytidine1402-2'-O)-methyltransferase